MSGFNDEKKLTQPSPDDAGLSDKMKQLNVLEKLQQSIAHKTGVADGAPADVNSMQSIDELKAFIRQQQYKAEIEKVKKKMAKKEKQGQDHKFWDTQPMAKLPGKEEAAAPEVTVNEPMDPREDISLVRQLPYKLPDGFEWSILSVDSEEHLDELYHLLTNNYVEDEDESFRFDYSPAFLRWALTPPGYNPDLHIGVRATKTGKLLASITGVPAYVNIHTEQARACVEINFLCVHKKLRDKRLAPVLIKEVTRRVNLTGVWQAVYTAGLTLPGVKAECRYWHRNLQPKKLSDIKFSYLPLGKQMKDWIKELELSSTSPVHGFRQMTDADVPEVTRLLNEYLSTSPVKLAPVFSEADVRHLFVFQEGVVCSYVLDKAADGKADGAPILTDFLSFYHLPSSIMKHATEKKLHAVYSFYNVANTMTFTELMNDSLILAKHSQNADVFNCLDVMKNREVLEPLKFGKGDGCLQYYLYNWNCANFVPEEVGLVLC